MNDVSSFVDEARNENQSDLAQKYGSAIQEGQGLINRPDNYNQGLSFGNQALSQAIRNKYQGQNLQPQAMALESRRMATESHLNKLNMASQLAADEANMNLQKEILRQKKKQAQRAARGQVLGAVLGIGGAIAGGAVTGGNAAGIMAGASAGQGVGQAMGEGL